MNLLFLLNSIISLIIFSISLISFFACKKDALKKLKLYLFAIGISYFVLFLIFLLWIIGFLSYSSRDYSLIYCSLVIFQSLVIFKAFYDIKKNKNLFYIAGIYIIGIFSVFIISFKVTLLFLNLSFLLLAFVFLNLMFTSEKYKKPAFFGFLYSFVSFAFQLLLLFNLGDFVYYSGFSNFIFIIVIYFFVKSLASCPPEIIEKENSKREVYVWSFIKYFVFIIILSNFIFVGSIGLHEFGHLIMSKVYDCEYRQVVYEENSPYTELLCSTDVNKKAITLAGIIFPIITSIVLFFVGGRFIKEISLMIIGFDLIASYKDLLDLGVSENISALTMIFGIFFIIAGVILLAKSRTEVYQKIE